MTYLCSSGYNPTAEHGVNPLDPEIGIEWPTIARDGSPLVYELSGRTPPRQVSPRPPRRACCPKYDAVTAYLRARTDSD